MLQFTTDVLSGNLFCSLLAPWTGCPSSRSPVHLILPHNFALEEPRERKVRRFGYSFISRYKTYKSRHATLPLNFCYLSVNLNTHFMVLVFSSVSHELTSATDWIKANTLMNRLYDCFCSRLSLIGDWRPGCGLNRFYSFFIGFHLSVALMTQVQLKNLYGIHKSRITTLNDSVVGW